ncbi:MAG: hypothetical protein KDA31_04330 [Phycisphaerales bacterium]|nr:hypothetical protein [Phycisphaerales bacterium]MCB9835555.1 hypothetical protein [Phycisphaera sp.]
MSGSLFGEVSRDAQDEAIVGAYENVGTTLDALPYTPEFEKLIEIVRETDADAEHRAVFHRLHNLRKAGKLPRMGRASSSPPVIDYEHEQLLVRLVADEVGSLGQRDQLPYTDGFDRVAGAFANQTGLNLSQHDLWRVIAKLAK